MGPQNGAETGHLQPAGVELGVDAAHAEPAGIGVHVAHSPLAHAEHHRHLGLVAAPRALNVARPREHRVALHARPARAGQVEDPLFGEFPGVIILQDAGPHLPVGVVHGPGGAGRVLHGFGVVFGFAEVGPPAGRALVAQRAVVAPQPGAGSGPEHVQDAGRPGPERGHGVGPASRRGAHQPARAHRGVVARGPHHVGLRDENRLHAQLFQAAHHAHRVGETGLVPAQIALPGGATKPIQVQHQRIEREVFAAHAGGCLPHLGLGLVAETALNQAQGPAGRQRLPAGEGGVAVQDFGLVAAGYYEVREGREAFAAVLQHVRIGLAQIEVASCVVVEKQHIPPAAEHGGQGYVQVGLIVLGGVMGLVVELQAVAAPVERQRPRAGAVQPLARREAEPHGRAAGLGCGGRGGRGGAAAESRAGFAKQGVGASQPGHPQQVLLNHQRLFVVIGAQHQRVSRLMHRTGTAQSFGRTIE